jgi:hypothetical protein
MLAMQFSVSGHWRIAQHLANELLLAGRSISLAFYFADRALQLSGGNAFARLSVARCFWLQRFPEGVLHHLYLVRRHARSLSPRLRRKQFCDEIADLHANVLCYCGRLELATPWIWRVLKLPRCRIDTLVQIFNAAFGTPSVFEFEVARRLAPYIAQLSGRDRQRVTLVLRRHLLATIRERL